MGLRILRPVHHQPPSSAPRSPELPGQKLRRSLGWLLWVHLLGVFATHAASPALLPEHVFEALTTEEGLPQNHITSIVQTREGYLWLGTYNGLVRFDGVRFTVFDRNNTPGLASSRVTSLLADSRGTLWIGHDAGELSRMDGDLFARVALPPIPSPGEVTSMREDALGDLWLLVEDGVLMRTRDGFTVPPETARDSSIPPSLERDELGVLWRTHRGRLRKIDPRGGMLTADVTKPGDFYIHASSAAGGGLWVVSARQVRRRLPGGEEQPWGPAPWEDGFVTAIRETPEGGLWVGTLTHGLFLLGPEGRHVQYARTNGLGRDWVRSLGLDREGTLWVGTGGGGMLAARERRVQVVELPAELRGREMLSFHPAANGSLWAGTEGGGLLEYTGREWRHFGEREGLTNQFVWSVLTGPGDAVWAGTWGGGLFTLRNGRFTHPEPLAGMVAPVTALHPASRGRLWVGTRQGLALVDGGKVEWFGTELDHADVRTVAEAPDGTVWFGMSGGGLGRLRDGRITRFRRPEGLPSDHVWSLLPEPDGTLWIGTFGGGLCRFRNGRFATIGTENGIPNNVIGHIADDGHGWLWMGSYGGILRAEKQALNACAEGSEKSVVFHVYGRHEGLTSLECAEGLSPGGGVGPDGRLWFATRTGPAAVSTASVRINPRPPPVWIEELRLEGTPVGGIRTNAPQPLTLPVGRRRAEFRFTALSFTAPERVRFRYRLEGLDPDWVDGGTRRTASYSLLPAGDYVFRVTGCNGDGIWNETGASLAIRVPPHAWETWWFRAGAGCAGAGLLAGVVRTITRRRYRRKLDQLERKRAIDKERARIAQDIHDELGASLTRIGLLSQSVQADLPAGDASVADLDQIYTTARDLTRAMDEIVWAVNPRHDTLDSLASYLGGYAQEFLAAARIRCRLELPVDLPPAPLPPETRHNLFMALKEGLHNVVRHAQASEVRISLAPHAPGFALTVEDNGRGFATDGGTRRDLDRLAGGNGLGHMRSRLEQIGGRCEISPGEAGGTRLRMVFPVRVAGV